MSKKHIITFGYQDYAVDSITAATQAVALLSKLTPVRLNHSAEDRSNWFYEPADRCTDVKLELNQPFRDPAAKPKRKPKIEALPAPKRGSILCICEKSYVAPRQACPHCGRPFAESHNRTHDSNKPSSPDLHLL